MTDGTTIDGTLDIGGRERTFTMHLPERASGEIPLVVVLHVNVSAMDVGAGGPFMRSMTTFDAQADRFGFAVAYPDGTDGSWADGRGVSPADRAGVDDVSFLRELISWSARAHGTLPDRAIVAGMSNGGCMAHRMGVSASDQVAVIAAVAGGLPERVRDELPAPDHAVSALLIHGTADPIAPVDGGYARDRDGQALGRTLSLAESASFWLDTDKCPADAEAQVHSTQLSARTTAGGGVGGTCVSTWTVRDGGHTWPGAEPRPGFRKGLTTEFDAAEEICRFALPLLGPAVGRQL